ncbi:hypothetical protein [endosymbiont GvMRE of Glomus versiforme]|uniref:hypothetical protein n=1 Tax=endosymbiont GvMRE of Glomus versiforme TaxID=2039283 RepID=UPI000EB8F765|nr:hypothetical protein [endosymbiont GvMRE of Glomus versiforme]RHZ35450.1 hypothetical protein GvMRE_IIg413 [endosymbiont GvMRE of Glomus versiforme]
MENRFELKITENETKIVPNNQDYFWIELETTKRGYEKLSLKLNGEHYIGFLNQNERKNKDILWVR